MIISNEQITPAQILEDAAEFPRLEMASLIEFAANSGPEIRNRNGHSIDCNIRSVLPNGLFHKQSTKCL